MEMKLIVLVLLIALCFTDLSDAKRKKKEKKKMKIKEIRGIAEEAGEDVKEELEKLKAQVEKLPKNVVHIHMHGGNEGHKHDHHHHDNETEGDDNEQHIHMHMHVESDCHDHEEEIHAHCEVMPNSKLQDGDDIYGVIHMTQKGDGPVNMFVNISGFDMTKENAQHFHGFHVHAYGDMSESCDSLGGHYNPEGTSHSSKDAHSRHTGDLGNIGCDMNGNVHKHMTDDRLHLHGEKSLIGRSIVIHHGPDDLGMGGDAGSLSSGNAGPKIACCIIALADPKKHHDHHHEHTTGDTEESHDHSGHHHHHHE